MPASALVLLNEHELREVASDASLCARALQRLLPALVHRLNNALAVVQGVHDLGTEALASEREQATRGLATLRQVLARLGALARLPDARTQPFALVTALQTQNLLLVPLAESLGVQLETYVGVTEAGAVDGRFEALLFALTTALVLDRAGSPASGRRMRLAARARPGAVRLTLVAAGPTRAAATRDELAALAAYAAGRGWRMVSRAAPNGFALRALLPGPADGRACVPVPVPRRRRVLLLHGASEERELAATLLREHGCIVSETPEEPSSGVFDLVLVEQRIAHAEPALSARLSARFGRARVEILQPRARPGSLLALLGS